MSTPGTRTSALCLTLAAIASAAPPAHAGSGYLHRRRAATLMAADWLEANAQPVGAATIFESQQSFGWLLRTEMNPPRADDGDLVQTVVGRLQFNLAAGHLAAPICNVLSGHERLEALRVTSYFDGGMYQRAPVDGSPLPGDEGAGFLEHDAPNLYVHADVRPGASPGRSVIECVFGRNRVRLTLETAAHTGALPEAPMNALNVYGGERERVRCRPYPDCEARVLRPGEPTRIDVGFQGPTFPGGQALWFAVTDAGASPAAGDWTQRRVSEDRWSYIETVTFQGCTLAQDSYGVLYAPMKTLHVVTAGGHGTRDFYCRPGPGQ